MRVFLVGSLLLATGVLAQAPDAAVPSDAASFVATLEAHWVTRDSEASIAATNVAIRDGLKAFPDDYEILWRAARFRWWTADGETNEKNKRMVAKEGWNYAKRAVDAKPTGSEGKYYVALSIGAYSQAVGIFKALTDGLEGQFVENLDFALKSHEAFDRYGARRAKGRYYWELPWPKRDLKKSREELARAISGSPEHLRNYYYLAQTLLKDGDAKGAKEQIAKVVDGAPDFDPPEARRVKAWARPVADEIQRALK
jgi:tetratricopeptide (TPR) repeat protein